MEGYLFHTHFWKESSSDSRLNSKRLNDLLLNSLRGPTFRCASRCFHYRAQACQPGLSWQFCLLFWYSGSLALSGEKGCCTILFGSLLCSSLPEYTISLSLPLFRAIRRVQRTRARCSEPSQDSTPQTETWSSSILAYIAIYIYIYIYIIIYMFIDVFIFILSY